MRAFFVAAALLVSGTGFAHPQTEARYIRYHCQAWFANGGNYYQYDGCSDKWYPPSLTNDKKAKDQAKANALSTCGDDSSGIQCHLLDDDCQLQESDSLSPPGTCP